MGYATPKMNFNKDDSYHMIGKWILGFPFDKPTYADVGNVPQYTGL